MKNYFELFQLPDNFSINSDLLTERYHALQSELHPDRFASSADTEKHAAMRYSALVNDAYNTLKIPVKRAFHLLALHGVSVDLESTSVKNIELLEKQMMFREQLAESQDLSGLQQEVISDIIALETLLTELFHQKEWDKAKEALITLQFYTKLQKEIKEVIA